MSDFSLAAIGGANTSLSKINGDLVVRGLRDRPNIDNPSRIDKAARDFESVLVGQWLEKAEKSFATVPGEDPDQSQDSGRDQFQSIACQYLAEGLSKSGSFGIASMIRQHLSKATAVESPTTAKLQLGK